MFCCIADRFEAALWIHIFYIQTDNSYFIPFESLFLKSLFKVKQVLDGVPLVSNLCTFECVFD